MAEQSASPQQTLARILETLQHGDQPDRLAAIQELHNLNYTSEAICAELENLALNNREISAAALSALDLPASRNVRGLSTKLNRGERTTLLNEIDNWEQSGLLEKTQADILKRRYNFDFILAPPIPTSPPPAASTTSLSAKPQPAPVKETLPSPEETPAPIPHPIPSPTERGAMPRPTLLQTLLSETSIKIALYLGAFFVIASAVILGALVEAARLPILIIGTVIFGAVAVAIRKRLPQPSFALFIVFSFLLPITANVIEESLGLFGPVGAGYWTVVSLFMAAIWGVSTWLYESRLFSVTAFIALAAAFYRVGGIFDAEPEFALTMSGSAALVGLFGTLLLKNWKDSKFAFPLFTDALILQTIVLLFSLGTWILHFFDTNGYTAWNIASIITWLLAFGFFAWANRLYPFVLFPWFAAAALIPIPWFGATIFDAGSTFNTFLFFGWGAILSIASEAIYGLEVSRKYSLPILIASAPAFLAAIVIGFLENDWLAFGALLGIAVIYGIIHYLRPRGLLWAASLLAGIGAYFTFFQLPFLETTNVFFGFQLLVISLILLAPDLLLKANFKENQVWRLPPRIFGALFVLWTFASYAASETAPLINTAIIFGVYAVFFAAYSIRYNQPALGFITTISLALSVIYSVNHFDLNLWLETLTALSVIYYFAGFALRKDETRALWSRMLKVSGFVLGGVISLAAIFSLKEAGGWYIAVIGLLFVVEMYSQKQGLYEMGPHLLLPAALYLILRDYKLDEFANVLLGFTLTWFSLDLIFSKSYKHDRLLYWPVRAVGALAALACTIDLMTEGNTAKAAIFLAALTVFFTTYALVQRKAVYGYAPAGYLPLATIYTLQHFDLPDAWLPALTAIAVLYFISGLAIRSKPDWSFMLRNSALALSAALSLGALVTLKETGGWYALAAGLLFAAEMYLRRDGWFEIGMPAMFNIGAFLILRDFDINELSYHLLAYSLVWILTDLLAHLTFANPRVLKWPVRGIGALLTIINYGYLFTNGLTHDSRSAAICFGIYTLLFLTVSLLYRQPTLLYTFTVSLPLFVTFLFREFDVTQWIHPVIIAAAMYYAAGYFLRHTNRAKGWDTTLLFSGLGLGVVVSFSAPILGGLDASIPVAAAATLWAVEAFARKNVWLGFPTNALYLLAYFMILFELKVDEPQYFSMGAALLGMVMHYLLVRAGSKTGAFMTGMVSQLILLGTTYTQMLDTERLIFFVVLFFQSLAVLTYGIIIRSRSLVFTPIVFSVLGVVTVIYSALKGISTVVLIGCTGIILLMLGILAVVMRERITKLGERLSEWQA